MNRVTRLAALAGMIGPLLFGSVLLVLTVVEYDFMRTLGWEPLSVATVVWPSGLALGPYGYVMTAAFLVNGLLVVVFALGLGQTLPGTTASRVAATLPSMLTFGWAFRQSSGWRGLSTYTWLTAALAVPTFALKGVLRVSRGSASGSTVLSEPIPCERVAKQQARLSELLRLVAKSPPWPHGFLRMAHGSSRLTAISPCTAGISSTPLATANCPSSSSFGITMRAGRVRWLMHVLGRTLRTAHLGVSLLESLLLW